MRYAAILALSLSFAAAQDVPETDAAPAVQEGISVEEAAKPYLELAAMHEALLREMASALAGVTDKESADAAAPAVQELAERVLEIQSKEREVLALGEPSAEVQQYLQEQAGASEWNALVRDSVGKAFDLLSEVPPCYGSESLTKALFVVLDLYLGEPGE